MFVTTINNDLSKKSTLLKSTDGGQNFTQCGFTSTGTTYFDEVDFINYNPITGELFAYARDCIAGNWNVFRSTDLGEIWEFKNDDLPKFYNRFTFNPITGETYVMNQYFIFRCVPDREITSIAFDPYGLDFSDGTSLQKNVRIKNNGSKPLTLSSFEVDGSAFSLPNNETTITIQPGGSYDLVVQFSSTTDRDYYGSIMLIDNANGSRNYISLRAKRRPVIAIETTSIDFGEINIGTSPQKSVTITNSGNAPLVISSFVIEGSGFTLPNNNSTITVQPNSSYELYVQFLPAALTEYTGTITLTHNGSGSPTSISLNGKGIGATITLSSTSIDFGDVNIGTSPQTSITITNSGNAALVISSVVVDGSGFILLNNDSTITVQPNSSYELYVQFLPTVPTEYTGTIILTHNGSDSLTTIPLSGKGIAATITLSSTSIDFGDVSIGTSPQTSITITNSGNAVLVISSTTINGDGFTLPNNETTITIEPDGNHNIMVQFLPLAPIEYTGTITLTHNGSDSLTIIQLSGKGVQAISVDEIEEIPTTYSLMQNYPNPFNPTTKIQYSLPEVSYARLSIYNSIGQEVMQLVNENNQSAGKYIIDFNAQNLPSGIYFYKLQTTKFVDTKKMLLLK
jgi:hypothetical protein